MSHSSWEAEPGRPSEDQPRSLRGKRIVICNWRDSAHPQAGGAEQYCEHIAEELAIVAADVTYLTARAKGTARREDRSWGQVIRLGGTLTTYPLVLAWLWIHRRSIDAVIDSQNGIPYFTPLGVGSKVPVALVIHHVHQEQFDHYFPRPLNLVGRFLEKQVSRWVYGPRPICVVSPSTRASVRRQLKFRGPIFIAPNGLHRDAGHSDVSRSEHPTIVSVGRLVSHKRMELLLDALPDVVEAHPGTVVHIVGDGECRADLMDRSRRLGLDSSVRFHGRLTDAERDRLVGQAWLAVNPSSGEGWGLSVIEAAAFGVPTVAFQVPGLEDSVRPGETGWLVESGQALGEITRHALTVLSERTEAERWASRCHVWASAFTWSYTAERLFDVLTSEAERISRRYDERRTTTDSTTVVALPPGVVGERRVLERLRATDQVRMDLAAERVELLLAGADEHDVERALARLGIERHEWYWTRIARYRDHLGWQSKGQFLNHPSVGTVRHSEGGGLDDPIGAELDA
jgi:glycosyltransferase involved in cell wall biosynthesis